MSNNSHQICVCGLADVHDIVSRSQATGLVSVLESSLIPETPETVAPQQHFKLAVDDIEAPFNGLQHAEQSDLDTLCNFARHWQEQNVASQSQCETLVIHCYAGVSRSTAAAFVVLCALNPDVSEHDIAQFMRAQSPTASPNRMIVALGDDVLKRKGRMLSAVGAMGRPIFADRARPFTINSRLVHQEKRPFAGPAAA